MEINLILAITDIKDGSGDEYAFGANNDLVCTNSLDMKRFKSLTGSHPMIMGRATFESMGAKPLPNRPAIVITSKSHAKLGTHAEMGKGKVKLEPSYDDAIAYAKNTLQAKECWVIGGVRVIKEAISRGDVDNVFVTRFVISVPRESVDRVITSDDLQGTELHIHSSEGHQQIQSKVLGEDMLVDTHFIQLSRNKSEMSA